MEIPIFTCFFTVAPHYTSAYTYTCRSYSGRPILDGGQ